MVVAAVIFSTCMHLALNILPCIASTSCSSTVFNLYEENIFVCYDYTDKFQKIRLYGT